MKIDKFHMWIINTCSTLRLEKIYTWIWDKIVFLTYIWYYISIFLIIKQVKNKQENAEASSDYLHCGRVMSCPCGAVYVDKLTS